jgi:hypothetical protein
MNGRFRRVFSWRTLVVCLSALPALAIPALASGGGQNANYNWTGQDPGCTYIQSYISGSGNFIVSGVTQSWANAGCASQWGRPAGSIGVLPRLYRNGALCTQPTSGWQFNPSYGQTSWFWSHDWGSVVPCGAGATFNTRTLGRVHNGSVWRPNDSGTPYIVSPNATW